MISFYIKNFISNNKWFSISILVAILSFIFAGKFDRFEQSISPIGHFKHGNKHLYIYYQDGYKVSDFEEEQKIVNGVLYYDTYHPLNIVLWVIFAIFAIVIIVYFVSDEIEKVDVGDYYIDKVESFQENGNYYYRLEGRLILTKDRLASNYDVRDSIKSFLLNKNIFPIWKSKVEKRLEATKDL